MHEHLFIDATKGFREPDDPWEKRLAYAPISLENFGYIMSDPGHHRENLFHKDVGLQIDEVTKFKEAGGSSIIDVTPNDLGRYPEGLKIVAERTGVNIVCGTAYYVAGFAREDMDSKTVEEIRDTFVRELTDGIGETGIRAGIIGELGNTEPWVESEKKVLRAGAAAQRETGAAITIHPGRSRASPVAILKLLKEEGADMDRVIMGHLDRTLDQMEEYDAVASFGSYMELDLFGYMCQYPLWTTTFPFMGDSKAAVMVKDLIDAGYVEKILLSHDVAYKTRFTKYGGYGLTFVQKSVVPRLLKLGVTEDQINQMLIRNPKTVLPIKST